LVILEVARGSLVAVIVALGLAGSAGSAHASGCMAGQATTAYSEEPVSIAWSEAPGLTAAACRQAEARVSTA